MLTRPTDSPSIFPPLTILPKLKAPVAESNWPTLPETVKAAMFCFLETKLSVENTPVLASRVARMLPPTSPLTATLAPALRTNPVNSLAWGAPSELLS